MIRRLARSDRRPPLHSRDRRSISGAEIRCGALPRGVRPRTIAITIKTKTRALAAEPMISAQANVPFTTAAAVAFVRGSGMIRWLPRMADRPASFAAILGIDRGVTR